MDQDKRDLAHSNVKPAQLILDFQMMVFNALVAQPIKLFHHSVYAQHAQLDKKLMPLEMVATQSKFHVEEDKEEFQSLNAENVIFTPRSQLMADPALVAVLV